MPCRAEPRPASSAHPRFARELSSTSLGPNGRRCRCLGISLISSPFASSEVEMPCPAKPRPSSSAHPSASLGSGPRLRSDRTGGGAGASSAWAAACAPAGATPRISNGGWCCHQPPLSQGFRAAPGLDAAGTALERFGHAPEAKAPVPPRLPAEDPKVIAGSPSAVPRRVPPGRPVRKSAAASGRNVRLRFRSADCGRP
jgi:hypothetical protein